MLEGSCMTSQGVYSVGRFLALCALFAILGTASAASITAFVSTYVEKPRYAEDIVQDPSSFSLQTDRDSYYPGDTVRVYLVSLLEERILFEDDAFGLHIEEWVNGTWESRLAIGNSSLSSSLGAIGDPTHQTRATFTLGDSFGPGGYRVVSVGEILQDGLSVKVEAYKEFEIEKALPPLAVFHLDVRTDKDTYYRDEDMVTVTIKSRENVSAVFGDSDGFLDCTYKMSFEKWNGSWVEYEKKYPSFWWETHFLPEESLVHAVHFISLRDFNAGRYRVLVEGRVVHNEQTVFVWGYAEFTVE